MRFGGPSSAQGNVLSAKIGQRTGLPLVPCPKCGEEILELTCGEGSKVPRAIFFKCHLHERDVPGTCPWYLFADKYHKMLLAKGIITNTGAAVAGNMPEESMHLGEQTSIAIGGNHTELAPLLDDVVCLKNRVDEKLQNLVVLGRIAAVCLVVVAVFVVLGVIIMLVK